MFRTFEQQVAGVMFLFDLDSLDTCKDLNADLKYPSYDQQSFGPRHRRTGHVDVELPQAFAERKELPLIALEDLWTI